MANDALSDKDIRDLRDKLVAEIGARINNTSGPRSFSGPQLLSAARELNKLVSLQAPTPAGDSIGGDDLDLFSLVERLPKAQRVKHLNAERVRLQERLQRIEIALT